MAEGKDFKRGSLTGDGHLGRRFSCCRRAYAACDNVSDGPLHLV